MTAILSVPNTPGGIPLHTATAPDLNQVAGHVLMVETPGTGGAGPTAAPAGVPGSPLVTADAVADAALGTPSDAAYGGSGPGTVVALLKAALNAEGGSATAANQTTANTNLATLVAQTAGLATAAGQTTAAASLAAIATNTGAGATAAGQGAANTSLATVATNTGTAATLLASLISGVALASKQAALNGDGGSLAHVTNFPTTQSVSGTVALGAGSAAIGTVAVTGTTAVSGTVGVSALPALPAGTNAIGSVTATTPVTTPIDHSSTIASGSAAQQLMAANVTRIGFSFMCGSDVWISLTGTASAAYGAGSIKLPAGDLYESPPNMRPTGSVSIFCATAAAPYSAMEW